MDILIQDTHIRSLICDWIQPIDLMGNAKPKPKAMPILNITIENYMETTTRSMEMMKSYQQKIKVLLS